MATKNVVKESNLEDNVIKPIDAYLKNKDPKLADYVKKVGLDSANKEDLDLLEKAMGGDAAAEDSLCKKAGCTGIVETEDEAEIAARQQQAELDKPIAEDEGEITDLDVDGEEPIEGEPEAGEGEPTGDEENPEELDYNDENVTALDIIKAMTQKILSAMGEDAENLEDELNPEGEPVEGEPEGDALDLDAIPDNSEIPDEEVK